MASSIILNGPHDLDTVRSRAEWMGYPCTVSFRKGAMRSNPQNHLAQKWAGEASAYLGDRTPEEMRGHFKLHHGVPIRREDPSYAEAYDRVIRPLPYELKLLAMQVPLDFPVTRDMTMAELTRYLDSIAAEFCALGVPLTFPKRGNAA